MTWYFLGHILYRIAQAGIHELNKARLMSLIRDLSMNIKIWQDEAEVLNDLETLRKFGLVTVTDDGRILLDSARLARLEDVLAKDVILNDPIYYQAYLFKRLDSELSRLVKKLVRELHGAHAEARKHIT